MSASTPSFFQALSVVAVILSGAAIYISQQPDSPPPTEGNSPVAFDSSPLEESMERIHSDLLTLETRLDALEQTAPDEETGSAEEIPADLAQIATVEALEVLFSGKLVEAVDRVMEEKGVEYARRAQKQAEIEDAREGTSRWVDGSVARLPRILDRVADQMNLGNARFLQVEEILTTSIGTAAHLTDELYSDPPPNAEQSEEIIGEIKSIYGQLGEQLGEVLNKEEMGQFGRIVGVIRKEQAQEAQQQQN